MTNEPKRTGDRKFIAFESALRIIDSLRGVVVIVRRHDRALAQQIVSAASSVAANLAEGNERVGRDRLHLFRIAAGSAAETRAHLRVALAWRWIASADCEASLALIDEELAMLWRLTH